MEHKEFYGDPLWEIGRRLKLEPGNKYSPCAFVGKWKRREKNKVKATLLIYESGKVSRMFSTWIFHKLKDNLGFFVKRSTWDMGGFSTDTIDELVDRIHNYYARKENQNG